MKTRRPLLILALALAAGSLSGALTSPSYNFVIAAFAAFFVSLLFSLHRLLRTLIFISAFFWGAALSSQAVYQIANVDVPIGQDTPAVYEGVIVSSPDFRPWGAYLDVKLEGGKIRLSVSGKDLELSRGDKIKFRAKFARPRDFKNPGVFSWSGYLLSHGIAAQGKAVGNVEKVGQGGIFTHAIEKIRRNIRSSIAANLTGSEQGVAEALSIGVQSGIDPESRDAFAGAGLAHILAISGMNVGYVAAVIYLLSRFIFGFFPWLTLRVPVKQLSAIVTLPSVWCYVLVAGSPISAVRAGIMLTVFLVGMLLLKRQDLITTLAVSVIVILLLMPLSILDVSFQLSVVAVAGIILATPEFMRMMGGEADKITRRGRMVFWAKGLVTVSLAAGLATIPLVAYHFKLVSILGFVANLVAVPVTGAILSPLVALSSLICLFSQTAAGPLWHLSGYAAHAFIWFASMSADAGSFLIFHFAPTRIETVLMYVALGVLVFLRRIRRKKAVLIAVAVFIVIDVGWRNIAPTFDRDLVVTVLDVGQGDSSIVRFPNGEVMLIDGGGIKGSSFDIGRNVVAHVLWKNGIHEVDWIVLTHPHYDHYEGLSYIVQNFSPRCVWTSGLEAEEDDAGSWEAFKTKALDARAPFVDVGKEGVKLEISGAHVEIFEPPDVPGKNLNDTSLVTRIDYGAQSFLFTGDLSEAGERELLGSGRKLSAGFLKVGHHGSRDASSAEFLSAVNPKTAVISVGLRNNYGLPAKETLARLGRTGTEIHRTDLDGAVMTRSDGSSLEVSTFVPR